MPRSSQARIARSGARESPVGPARRELLLETTLRLISHEGIDAVSHRRVADLAGVPLGSTTYYFASRDDMLIQALSWFARAEMRTLRSRVAAFPGIRDLSRLIDEFVRFIAPQEDETRSRTIALYTLYGEAARRPALTHVAREWNESWWSFLIDVFDPLGVTDPRLEARMFLAMLDGLVITQLAAPDEDFTERVLRPALRRWFDRTVCARA